MEKLKELNLKEIQEVDGGYLGPLVTLGVAAGAAGYAQQQFGLGMKEKH